MLMKDFGVTAMCCTPTYFLHLIDRAAELGIDMKELPLRAGIFGAEPWTESMRKHIEKMSSIEAFDIYGLSEIIGPGVGCECRRHQGLHIFEDHFYPEIVDPETGAPLADGCEGELVLTTLSKQAMPMIRYRTRDITRILPGQCACGRTLRRIDRIGRRSDDMLIIRGVNVFPSQVETALLADRGHPAALPDRADPRAGTGPDGSPGRSNAADVQRQDRRAAGAAPEASRRAGSGAGNSRAGCAGRGEFHRAQRRQGKTRHRQAERMKIQQISMFVENKPGHLTAPARLLAEEGIDLRSLYLADTQQFGIVRMIVSDWQKAAQILETHGYAVKVTDVLAVEVADRPGGMTEILGALDGIGINIEYMYAFPWSRTNEAILIFRFADLDAAIARLQEAGINLVTHEELLTK